MWMLIFYWCSQLCHSDKYFWIFWILVRIVKTFALGWVQISQRNFATLSLTTRKMCWQPRWDAAENLGLWRNFYCSVSLKERIFWVTFSQLIWCGTATVSRSFIQGINFMYLKFRQICIWPPTCKAVLQHKSCLLIANEQAERRQSAYEAASFMPREVLQQAEKFSIVL